MTVKACCLEQILDQLCSLIPVYLGVYTKTLANTGFFNDIKNELNGSKYQYDNISSYRHTDWSGHGNLYPAQKKYHTIGRC